MPDTYLWHNTCKEVSIHQFSNLVFLNVRWVAQCENVKTRHSCLSIRKTWPIKSKRWHFNERKTKCLHNFCEYLNIWIYFLQNHQILYSIFGETLSVNSGTCHLKYKRDIKKYNYKKHGIGKLFLIRHIKKQFSKVSTVATQTNNSLINCTTVIRGGKAHYEAVDGVYESAVAFY